MARTYPLFIIDSSRQHGRGEEVDYISCTAADCQFVAKAEFVTNNVYVEQYDKRNDKVIYSDLRMGLRIRITVLEIEGYDPSRLRSLLRKALKEELERHKVIKVDIGNVKNEDVIKFADLLMLQTAETLAGDPEDKTAKTVRAILQKIKEDYDVKG